MKTGPLPHSKRKLSPDLRAAVCAAMRDRRPKGQTLALVAGFPSQSAFSGILHARRITASPLTISRLQRVADIVGFSGPMFLAEEQS